MTDVPPPAFLDVPALLERSQPRPRQQWFWYACGLFALVVLSSSYASSQSPMMAEIVRALSGLAMLGLIAGMAFLTWRMARLHRAEQFQLEAAEELVTLRRWPQAAMVLEHLLSHPTRTPHARVQGLIYLSGVLARYNRFDDAIAVQDHLLDNVSMDGGTAHAIRLGRAMAMLRVDHLVDADRAINELRKQVSRSAQPETTEDGPLPQLPESAGLALLEIYRDVKTGHPAEALQMFTAKLAVLRRQLGQRVADAWVLAAKAYDLLNQPAEAQDAFEKATLLSPMMELARRYPEVASLGEKYRAAIAPM